MEGAAEGRVSVLVTSWEGPVVVLGYAQKPEDADLNWCRAEGLPVLRRLTGGTGVIHRGDLGVGLFLPQDHAWARGVVGLYGRFLDVLGPALHSLGSGVSKLAEPAHASRVRSPICFLDQLSDTLAIDGKKVVGCAHTRRRASRPRASVSSSTMALPSRRQSVPGSAGASPMRTRSAGTPKTFS